MAYPKRRALPETFSRRSEARALCDLSVAKTYLARRGRKLVPSCFPPTNLPFLCSGESSILTDQQNKTL